MLLPEDGRGETPGENRGENRGESRGESRGLRVLRALLPGLFRGRVALAAGVLMVGAVLVAWLGSAAMVETDATGGSVVVLLSLVMWVQGVLWLVVGQLDWLIESLAELQGPVEWVAGVVVVSFGGMLGVCFLIHHVMGRGGSF